MDTKFRNAIYECILNQIIVSPTCQNLCRDQSREDIYCVYCEDIY